MTYEKARYLATLVYGDLSVLELAILQDSLRFDFNVVAFNGLIALIECDPKTAASLAIKLGGCYKMARIGGTSIDDALENLVLPDNPKFSWTISAYGVSSETFDETMHSVRSSLKDSSLGKSRYLPPSVDGVNRNLPNHSGDFREMKLKDLNEKILHPEKSQAGFDIVVAGGLNSGQTLFGFTTDTSDHAGFEKRDFSRSYQGPTMTIGPRLARVLVNLAITKENGSLLDPFCGLGTILQEALITGYNVCGVDISSSKLDRCKSNLNWLRSQFGVSQKQRQLIKRGDAMYLVRENLPKIDGIASEPILLPIFAENPSREVASIAIREAFHVYRKTLESLRNLLDVGSRIALVAPAIVDSSGREHKIEFDQLVNGLRYRLFEPKSACFKAKYPFRVQSSRKKTIQRDVYVISAE